MYLRQKLFRDYIKDKDVIIVGNNLDALENKNGDLIDSYDRVIRLGKGIPSAMTSEYVGTFTHAWCAGELRLPMKNNLAKGTQILFNPSVVNRNKQGKWKPINPRTRMLLQDSNFIKIYNQRKIDFLKEKFGVSDDRRLSGGAILSHWLCHVCRGWKSLTWINFDCFKKSTLFEATNLGVDSISSSYHMPILGQKHIPADFNNIPYGHPAHDVDAETKLFLNLLKTPNTHWIGEKPSLDKSPEIIKTPNVIWTHGRREKKEEAYSESK